MVAVCTSETLIFLWTARCYNAEDHKLFNHHRERLQQLKFKLLITSISDCTRKMKIIIHNTVAIWGNYRRGMDWIMDLLTISVYHSELYFTDNWLAQASVLSLLQSKLANSRQWHFQWRIFSYPHTGPLVTATPAEIFQLVTGLIGSRLVAISQQLPSLLFTGWFSTDNWQLDPLTHQTITSRHFVQLNCW
jgi:hypothetical protein